MNKLRLKWIDDRAMGKMHCVCGADDDLVHLATIYGEMWRVSYIWQSSGAFPLRKCNGNWNCFSEAQTDVEAAVKEFMGRLEWDG